MTAPAQKGSPLADAMWWFMAAVLIFDFVFFSFMLIKVAL